MLKTIFKLLVFTSFSLGVTACNNKNKDSQAVAQRSGGKPEGGKSEGGKSEGGKSEGGKSEGGKSEGGGQSNSGQTSGGQVSGDQKKNDENGTGGGNRTVTPTIDGSGITLNLKTEKFDLRTEIFSEIRGFYDFYSYLQSKAHPLLKDTNLKKIWVAYVNLHSEIYELLQEEFDNGKWASNQIKKYASEYKGLLQSVTVSDIQKSIEAGSDEELKFKWKQFQDSNGFNFDDFLLNSLEAAKITMDSKLVKVKSSVYIQNVLLQSEKYLTGFKTLKFNISYDEEIKNLKNSVEELSKLFTKNQDGSINDFEKISVDKIKTKLVEILNNLIFLDKKYLKQSFAAVNFELDKIENEIKKIKTDNDKKTEAELLELLKPKEQLKEQYTQLKTKLTALRFWTKKFLDSLDSETDNLAPSPSEDKK